MKKMFSVANFGSEIKAKMARDAEFDRLTKQGITCHKFIIRDDLKKGGSNCEVVGDIYGLNYQDGPKEK